MSLSTVKFRFLNTPNFQVLLTGSAGGLGSQLADKLVECGAFIILVDREFEKNQIIKRRVNKKGGKCVAYVCDLSKREDIHNLVAAIKRVSGILTLIIFRELGHVFGLTIVKQNLIMRVSNKKKSTWVKKKRGSCF